MTQHVWTYGAAGSGINFAVTYDSTTMQFTVDVFEGAFDLNALWFSNGDGESAGYTLAKRDNSLNMAGATTVWSEDGTAVAEKIVWDGYVKVSNTGLGSLGQDKPSFLSAGDAPYVIAAPAGFDPDQSSILGIRATSVNGGDGIKFAATADTNDAPSAGADVSAEAPEDVSPGTVLATVKASDPDAGDNNDAFTNFDDLAYAFIGGNDDGLFVIDDKGNIALADGKSLDHETAQQHVLTVKVTDGAGAFDTVDVTLGVRDVLEAGEVWLLDDSGSLVSEHTKIQDAIAAAANGQRVVVGAGTWAETLTVTGKQISIEGQGDGVGGTTLNGTVKLAGVLDGTFALKDLALNAGGAQYGLYAEASSNGFAGEIAIDGVTVTGATQAGFFYARAGNAGTPTRTDTLGAVTITDSAFLNNGTANSGAGGRGDVVLFGFNGDLTVDDVTFAGPGPTTQKAIQVRGVEDGADTRNIGPYDAGGTVTLSDVTLTGTYGQDGIAFYRIASFEAFTADDVVVNANTAWGGVNLDGVGGTVNLSEVSGTNTSPRFAEMQGLASADDFTGTAGSDVLNGRGGNDSLTGGAGADGFVFNVALGPASNVDTIVDFSATQGDKIMLDDIIFSALSNASLAADFGTRILYDTTTGALSYDADGDGVGAIRFATLTGAPSLTASDFFIV